MKTLKVCSDPNFKGEPEVTWEMNGVYLHGEVERLCHYDINYPINFDDFADCVKEVEYDTCNAGKIKLRHLYLEGIFPCIVDDKYECTAYLWMKQEWDRRQRGLIVLNTDEWGKANAKMKYNERKAFL